jgi:hypothetical protein
MQKSKDSILSSILKEEQERLEALSRLYRKEINKLLKGYISIKKIKGNEYAYLSFRDKGMVRSIYLGKPSSKKVAKVKEQIKHRKDYELKLKEIGKNLKEIEKALPQKKIHKQPKS